MVEGLRISVKGKRVKAAIAKRIKRLEAAISRYRDDLKMDPKDQTDERPLLPDHMLENMIEEREDEIAALAMFRDNLVDAEVYLLAKQDMEFAHMIPPPPEPEPFVCMGRR